jgi:hypothetical protein
MTTLPASATLLDLLELIQQGVRPAVTFTSPVKGANTSIEDLESYAEPGMRARILGASVNRDDVLRLHVDFDEFDAHNASLESSNYYDKEGQARLTARQAGFYKPQDDLYFTPSDPCAWFMALVDEPALQIMDRWQRDGQGLRYTAFLEQEVLRLEGLLNPAPRSHPSSLTCPQ